MASSKIYSFSFIFKLEQLDENYNENVRESQPQAIITFLYIFEYNII